RGETLGEFKPGSLKLALKAGVPIVPITIRGSYRIMEQNGIIIKPAQVKVFISNPIYTDRLNKKQAAELPEKVREIIEQGFSR
ncbi:MAG: lysophospholipid acyltransferase family protein, partial [Desulfosporosinus sp.]